MSTVNKADIAALDKMKMDTFKGGKKLMANFNRTGSLPTVRTAAHLYRTSMQAMREKAKYLIPKEG